MKKTLRVIAAAAALTLGFDLSAQAAPQPRPNPFPKEPDMKKTLRVIAAAAALTLGFGLSAQAAPHGVKVGTLTCNVSSGWGFVFGSSKDLRCTFRGNGHAEHYTGSISKFGVDIGATAGGEMVWAVFAPTNRKFGALAGNYGGATAEATVGVGAGANVLVGGSDRTVTLQPLSVSGQTGLNVAAGVAGLTLRPAR